MKYAYSIVLLLFIAAGCDNAPTQEQSAGDKSATGKSGGTSGDFYKRLSGNIDGKAVVVQLHKFGALVEGYYLFTSLNKPTMVVNYVDTVADNTYRLTEIGPDGNTDEATTAHWQLTLTADGATGKWFSADGKQVSNIELKEEYPAGSIKLDAFYYTDTASLFHTTAYPKANVTYGVVYPVSEVEKTEASAFLRSVIASDMKLQVEEGVLSGLKILAWRYFGNYRLDMKGLVDSTSPAEMLQSNAYQYSTSFHHNVLYNDNNWVILEDASSQYTGGAHSTYSSTYQNLDISASKSWGLYEVLLDTNMLKPFLQSAIRAHFKMAQSEALGSRLLVDVVPVTNNMYITPSGLTFVYQPYEIASYADGIIQLFIPYEQILPLLTPEFIKRQGLEAKGGVAMR